MSAVDGAHGSGSLSSTKPSNLTLVVELTPNQLDVIAERVAERLAPASSVSPWLSTEQAAVYLAAKPSRIHDLVALGKLAPRRDGRRLLFRRDDLDTYLESGACYHPVTTPAIRPMNPGYIERRADVESGAQGQVGA